MQGLDRLPLSAEQVRLLPLGLRVIFYKSLIGIREGTDLHRVEPYKANVNPSRSFYKLISRI